MLAQKPRGIGLNKNAVNVDTSECQKLVTKGVNQKSPGEPSPPILKSHARNCSRQEQPVDDGISKENKLARLEPAVAERILALKKHIVSKQDVSSQLDDLKNKQNSKQEHNLPSKPDINLPCKQPAQDSAVSRIPRLSLRPTNINSKPLLNTSSTNNTNSNNLHLKKNLSSLIQLPSVAEEGKQTNVFPNLLKSLDVAAPLPAESIGVEDGVHEEIEDIDKSDSRDALFLVSDLAKDIYNYMYDLEDTQSVRENYLDGQKILTPKVRQRLINWCIDAHNSLKLLPETLYMTIAVIDRFFDRVQVKQQAQVQLVACGAMLVASKYEEIYPPDVKDLIYLTQNAYTKRDILRCEIEILEKLKFDLGKPIPLAFLRRFSKAAKCDLKMHSIAKYFMELSLTEYECAHWKPSLLAAAALFTTIHLVRGDLSSPPSNDSLVKTNSATRLLSRTRSRSPSLAPTTPVAPSDRWSKTLVHYTRYDRSQLQEPAGILCKILKRAQKSPQSYYCVKKNLANSTKWSELKSTRVDELIRQANLNGN